MEGTSAKMELKQILPILWDRLGAYKAVFLMIVVVVLMIFDAVWLYWGEKKLNDRKNKDNKN